MIKLAAIEIKFAKLDDYSFVLSLFCISLDFQKFQMKEYLNFVFLKNET
jgi:hypothetical protein